MEEDIHPPTCDQVTDAHEPRVVTCDPLNVWGEECDVWLGQIKRFVDEGFEAGYRPCFILGEL